MGDFTGHSNNISNLQLGLHYMDKILALLLYNIIPNTTILILQFQCPSNY